MFDNKQPLWLPEGSVRAIIALFVSITVVAYLIARNTDPAETALVGILGVVVGYYFSKANQSTPA